MSVREAERLNARDAQREAVRVMLGAESEQLNGERVGARLAAVLFGYSPSTVCRARRPLRETFADARAVGLDGKTRPMFDPGPEYRAERDYQIWLLHLDGVPMRSIADRFGCSVGTVHRACSRYEGYERRDRGER